MISVYEAGLQLANYLSDNTIENFFEYMTYGFPEGGSDFDKNLYLRVLILDKFHHDLTNCDDSEQHPFEVPEGFEVGVVEIFIKEEDKHVSIKEVFNRFLETGEIVSLKPLFEELVEFWKSEKGIGCNKYENLVYKFLSSTKQEFYIKKEVWDKMFGIYVKMGHFLERSRNKAYGRPSSTFTVEGITRFEPLTEMEKKRLNRMLALNRITKAKEIDPSTPWVVAPIDEDGRFSAVMEQEDLKTDEQNGLLPIEIDTERAKQPLLFIFPEFVEPD